MWRLVNGASRGLRARTPAPPSQNPPRNDDTERPTVSTFSIYPRPGESGSDKIYTGPSRLEVLSCQGPSQAGGRDNHGVPTEADILLREYFGPSWKNSNGQNESRQHHKGTPVHEIWNSLGMGTVWMTGAIIIGRTIFSNLMCRSRRREIIGDHISTWQDFERSYIYPSPPFHNSNRSRYIKSPRFWTTKLAVLPSALTQAPVCAAGGDSGSLTKVPSGAALSQDRVSFTGTGCGTKKKSVSFDEGITDEDPWSGSSGSDDLLSDDALEAFTEKARDCAGATFNIIGLQKARAKHYQDAFVYFQHGSKEGYAKSTFNLGVCYHKGFGTEKNIEKAIKLYDKAAYKGHVIAQYNLALLLIEKGGFTNQIFAVKLLEKSAINGFVKAQSYLGVFFTKPGKFQNFKMSVKMLTRAAEQGDVNSKYHLGICYEKGLGLKQNFSKAFDLYSSAAAAGHSSARYNTAVMLEEGCPGVSKNPQQAFELYTAGSEAGHKPSKARLLELELQRPTVVNQSASGYRVYYSSGNGRSTAHKDVRPTSPAAQKIKLNATKANGPMKLNPATIEPSLLGACGLGMVMAEFTNALGDHDYNNPFITGSILPGLDPNNLPLYDSKMHNLSQIYNLQRSSDHPFLHSPPVVGPLKDTTSVKAGGL